MRPLLNGGTLGGRAGGTMGSNDVTVGEATAVYYSHTDLAGFFPRSAILLIDFTVVLLVWVALLLLAVAIDASSPLPANIATLGFAWVYFAALKAGSGGTLGYRLTGFRLVNLQGAAPGLLVATYRFLLMLVGPIHLVFDLLWLTTDPNRQTLRDKLTATYVVRRNAQPAGRAKLSHPTYFIATLAFTLPEVKRPVSATDRG